MIVRLVVLAAVVTTGCGAKHALVVLWGSLRILRLR